MLKVLYFGDIVGRPGRAAVRTYLRQLDGAERPDVIIANAENASGGKGLDPATAEELRDYGIDVLTTGNHVWQHRGIEEYLAESTRVLRPANYPATTPGIGYTVIESPGGHLVAVVNLIGRVFMGPAECPFRIADEILDAIGGRTRCIVVDMHAEATSEKGAMGHYLDGRVSAVIGSHTHVQTADARVLAGGTGFLTDAGMCGPAVSVLGVRSDRVVERFLNQMPNRFDVAAGPVLVQGAALSVDIETGRTKTIERIQVLGP